MINRTDKIKFIAGIIRQSLKSIFIRCSKPQILQLPITGFCNSKCLTCNVWKKTEKTHIDVEQLKHALADPFFSMVQSVGINGGEITLVPNLEEIVDTVLTLQNLKTIWLISNCILDKVLLEKLPRLKAKCNKLHVKLGLTISIDGIGTLDDFIRGVPHAFEHADTVLQTINSNIRAYCDYCDIGCTVSKYNAPYLVEIQCWAKRYESIPVYYHLAVPNKRIGTFTGSKYSVLNDERASMLATEFFFSLYKSESSLSRKLQMWSNYYYLLDPNHRRTTTCSWLYQDVTIDEHLNLYYCATASEKIGNLKECSATKLIQSQLAKTIRRRLKHHCRNCIHYSYTLSFRGLVAFFIYYLREELFRGRCYK